MGDHGRKERVEIFSRVVRAGRRTYFFDVRPTKAGDYYLTITESKKFTNQDGSWHYKKHKIYLYKEDFAGFKKGLEEITEFILKEKGEEVISERHDENFDKEEQQEKETVKDSSAAAFTDISFDDI